MRVLVVKGRLPLSYYIVTYPSSPSLGSKEVKLIPDPMLVLMDDFRSGDKCP
jgi:hypothetical protein